MKLCTTTKGDIGVLKSKCSLYEQGFITFSPDTDKLPYDLLVSKNDKFYRVQVKYRELEKNGSINIRFRSICSNTKGARIKQIDKNAVDFYCVYCPQTDECYFFDHKKFNKGITLKLKYEGKTNKTCNYAEDFLKPPV